MKIFVSYSSKDREFVTRLATDLRNRGLDVWLDVWNITGRDPYWQEIEKAIEQATHVLFVISPDSIEEGCAARDELGHAKHHKKKIVVVMARPVPYDELPIEITPGRYQIHDFTTLAYADGLHSTLGALLGSHEMPTRQTPIPTQSQKKERNWLMIVGVLTLVGFVGLVALSTLFGDEDNDGEITPSLAGFITNTVDSMTTSTLDATDEITPTINAEATLTQNSIEAGHTLTRQAILDQNGTTQANFDATRTQDAQNFAASQTALVLTEVGTPSRLFTTQQPLSAATFPCTGTVKEDHTPYFRAANIRTRDGTLEEGRELSLLDVESAFDEEFYTIEIVRGETHYILQDDVEPGASCP